MAGEWNNLKEVARELDVHYMTAYRYVRQGRLDATWVDNGWQVHRDAIEAFRSTGDAASETSNGPVDWAAVFERQKAAAATAVVQGGH